MARYTRVAGSVGLITLANPPVNALSAAVRRGVSEALSRALSDPEVKSLVLCGDGGKFCAGADIREFSGVWSGPNLRTLIDSIEAGEKPVVAALEGVALGGGLELALGCHYRIAHTQAVLGLPEVLLGLIPGAGGTQRLPRLVGFPAAVDMITTGRHVSAKEALQLGLVNKLTDTNAQQAAVEFAQSVTVHPLSDRRLSMLPAAAPAGSLSVEQFLQEALARVRGRARGAPAPVACVQAVCAAVLPYSEGVEREAELMSKLFSSPEARALQYNFFSQRTVARWSTSGGARWDTSTARSVKQAGVIGLGTMGRGITVALVQAGIPVVAVEMNEQQLQTARQAVTALLERQAQKRGVPSYLGLVRFSLDIKDLRDADLVIEAVFEDMSLKKGVFSQLSAVCRPQSLLCTNTSGLDVDQLAAATVCPERVLGTHFFAPAHIMKLLEVVCGVRSSPDAMATAMQLGRRLGKVSVAVGNCPGFLGNRMLKVYLEQAVFMLEEGAEPQQVDGVLEEFGFAMGIFRVADLSGLDVGWRVRKEAGLTGPGVDVSLPRQRNGIRYSPLSDLLCEQGRVGQKTGQGWYAYKVAGGREAQDDPWVRRFLQDYRRQHGLRTRDISPREILERCILALINEGIRALEEGVAMGPEDVDVVWTLGYGWPGHKGGPMYHAAEALGLQNVLERLQFYARQHPDVPNLQPCALLRRLVDQGCTPLARWRDIMAIHRSHL